MTRHVTRQKGSVIVTTALGLLFLIGMMGIAVDFGRLFIVKSELQTAVDSCALAAAVELNGDTDATAGSVVRATRAGQRAGNLNRFDFQGRAVAFLDADIQFSDTLNGTYARVPASAATYRYARCTYADPTGIAPWLLRAWDTIAPGANYQATRRVSAVGVASLAPSQSSCPIPIGLCKSAGSAAPSFGFVPGQWIGGLVDADGSGGGWFRWLDFNLGGGGTKDLVASLKGPGSCSVTQSAQAKAASQQGCSAAAVHAYNTRFGVYQGGVPNPPTAVDGFPDFSGYAFFNDAPPAIPNKYPTFLAKRSTNSPYQGDNKSGKGPGDSENVGLDGVSPPGQVYPTDCKAKGGCASLGAVGGNRRVVPMPVLDCAAGSPWAIQGYACVLLLHPVKGGCSGGGPGDYKMWVEYLDNSGAGGTPSKCSSAGLAGGGGPLVPTLVQ